MIERDFDEQPRARNREDGLTILEAIVMLTIVVIGLLSMGATLVPVVRQAEAHTDSLQVLNRGISIIEEMKSVPDYSTLAGTYDGQTYEVDGIDGASQNNAALTVLVDDTDPNLINVVVSGEWLTGNETHGLLLRTDFFTP